MRLTSRLMTAIVLLALGLPAWAKDAPEPPPLALAPPLDADAKAQGTKLTIRGRTAPGAKVELRINGVIYESTAGTDGNFTIHDAPLKDGPNDLRLTATDAAGNATVIDRQVLRPITTGMVLLAPFDKPILRTGSATLELSGYCSPGAKLELKLDGPTALSQTTQADAGGTFRLTAPLAAGGYLLRLRASDGGGTVTRRLEVDLRAPDVQVIAPGPMAYVEAAAFEIAGRSLPGTSVTLTGAGNEVKAEADKRGLFLLKPVTVADGENHYVMSVADDLGNVRRLPVTIYGRVSNPWLEVAATEPVQQAGQKLDYVIEHEAGVRLSAQLGGQDVPLGATEAAETVAGVPRARTALTIGPLAPGHYELSVRAVSTSGKRQSGVLKSLQLPGPVRTLLLDASAQTVLPGGKVSVEAEVLDEWRQHVADGTEVFVRVPEGWDVDGRLPTSPVVLLSTKGGKAGLTLAPRPEAQAGLVLVTAGRLTDSRRLDVVRPLAR